MSDLDTARQIKRDLDHLIRGHGAMTLIPASAAVQEYIDRSSPATEDDLYAAFQAGFALGRQPGHLPGPWGQRLRTAYDKWRR